MYAPTRCALWENPELVNRPLTEGFELVEEYASESHLWHYLLKCRECGQLYFYEFYEEIDWVDGDDPQYVTYIPVESTAEAEKLKGCSPIDLLKIFPRLQKDHPKGAAGPAIRWTGKR